MAILGTPDDSADDQRRAANGYLVWPLAVANMVREDDDATMWARLHARQALVLGLIGSAFLFVVLALPLIAVIAIPAISNGATIGVYFAGLIADVAVAITLLVLSIRYAARASRGDAFSIPIVTPVVDRLFRMDQP